LCFYTNTFLGIYFKYKYVILLILYIRKFLFEIKYKIDYYCEELKYITSKFSIDVKKDEMTSLIY